MPIRPSSHSNPSLDLTPGTYAVQALLHSNADLNFPNAPGDAYSPVTTVRMGAANQETVVKLELSHTVPNEALPADSESVKFLKIRSQRLSEFHGRPIEPARGVILPHDFDRQPGPALPRAGPHRRLWRPVHQRPGDDDPRLGLSTRLDGRRCAADDPRSISTAPGRWATRTRSTRPTTDPMARAVTSELIPYIEDRFRGIGRGDARVLDGGSTGGWVALALQIFYPELLQRRLVVLSGQRRLSLVSTCEYLRR